MQKKRVVATLIAVSCAPAVHAQAQQPQVIHSLPVSDVVLEQQASGSGRVTGVLTNTSGHPLQSVLINFSILDDQSMQIGTATAAAMGVAEGGKWRFAATYTGANGTVASAKLGDIMAVTQP